MKHLTAAVVAVAALFAADSAGATMQTINNVSFDDSNAASTVLWAQGGVTTGPMGNRREACADPTNAASTVGPNGVTCRANEAVGFDLTTSVELDFNGTDPDDVLAVFFPQPVVNGAGSCNASANDGANGPANAAAYAGCDVLIFEVLNQPDVPTLALSLMNTNNNTEILGVLLAFIDDIDPTRFGDQHGAIWGFDLGGLGVAQGASVGNPLFVGNRQSGVNFSGSPDIAAIVGVNFGAPPPPQVPLPAALPLFFAGLAGLGFAARRRRSA